MNYASWSKEQLILKLIQLEKSIPQKVQKPFDFTKTRARKVALKISYLGHDYFGFTGLPTDSLPTIERELFNALLKCKLIPSVEGCGWSRSGRTDKGVSGFGNVVSLWIRTKLDGIEWDTVPSMEKQQFDNPYYERDSTTSVIQVTETKGELAYISILNRLLPAEIRVLGWTPVSSTFDARFSCTHRAYKYFFNSKGMDVDAMSLAASYFIGTHDCRHVCKIDPSKMDQPEFFTRTIFDSKMEHVDGDVWCYYVKGRAFLWHQVRNMMSLLFLVGKKRETPDLIRDILDLSKHPDKSGRPQYEMAPDGPLVLMECGYEGLTWYPDDEPTGTNPTLEIIQKQITETQLKLVQLITLKQECEKMGWTVPEPKEKSYTPIMKRKRCDSIEDLVEKKKK